MPIRTKQDFRKTYLCLQKTSEFESTLLMLPWSRKMAGCGGTQCHSESDQTLFRNFLNKKTVIPTPSSIWETGGSLHFIFLPKSIFLAPVFRFILYWDSFWFTSVGFRQFLCFSYFQLLKRRFIVVILI